MKRITAAVIGLLLSANLIAQSSLITTDVAREAMPYADVAQKVYVDASFEKWQLLKESDLVNGFYARLYQHSGTQEVIVSFEGTQTAIDWLQNASTFSARASRMQKLFPSDQFESALTFVQEVKGQGLSIDRLTGHSLGGALAQYTASHTDIPATVFNSLGLAEKGIGTYRKGPHEPEVIRITASAQAQYNGKVYGSLTDLVSRLGVQMGEEYRVNMDLGVVSGQAELAPFVNLSADPLSRAFADLKNLRNTGNLVSRVHSMSNLARALAAVVNTDTQDKQQAAEQHIIVVIDSSGSMNRSDPKNLRDSAVESLIYSAPDSTRLALLDFDDQVTELSPLTKLNGWGSRNRDKLLIDLQKSADAGGTDIVSAIEHSQETALYSDTQILLLSDGRDDDLNSANIHQKVKSRLPIHTIALSPEADVPVLSQIAAHTGGNYEYADNAGEVSRVMHNIFGSMSNQQVMMIKQKTIRQGQMVDYEVLLDSGLQNVYFQNHWLGSDVDMTLTSPSGQTISIAQVRQDGRGIEAPSYEIIRLQHPEAGKWTVELQGVDLPQPELNTTRVYTYQAPATVEWKDNLTVPEVNQPYRLSLIQDKAINWQQVKGEVTLPDGQVKMIEKTPEYQRDIFANDREKSIWELMPTMTGDYQLDLTLYGQDANGADIQRAINKTVQVRAKGKGVKKQQTIQPLIPRR